jgi:hypothetical protein
MFSKAWVPLILLATVPMTNADATPLGQVKKELTG